MKKVLMGFLATVAVMALATSAVAQSAGPKNGGQGGGKAGAGQGQRQGGGMMMRGKIQEEVLKKLNLTTAQKSKWDTITKQMRAEMDKIRAAGEKSGKRPDRQEMMAKFKGYNDKLMAVLTPKQKTDYEKYMKEAMEKARKERGGGPGGPGGGGAGGKGKGGGGN